MPTPTMTSGKDQHMFMLQVPEGVGVLCAVQMPGACGGATAVRPNASQVLKQLSALPCSPSVQLMPAPCMPPPCPSSTLPASRLILFQLQKRHHCGLAAAAGHQCRPHSRQPAERGQPDLHGADGGRPGYAFCFGFLARFSLLNKGNQISHGADRPEYVFTYCFGAHFWRAFLVCMFQPGQRNRSPWC